ncbi:MAG: putative rane protein [Anaerocolumna sp.]|jgi:ABC-2 type transport system permease protein|nr:putative rane protein [Anaerocolumna sp.]
MLAIYKKELRSYFTSMTGYVFIAFFLVIIGIYFAVYNLFGQLANFEYILSDASFIFVILIPILTMRLMAEEKKQKTDQLLLTSPVPISRIIVGKFLAVTTVYFIAMVIISLYPLITSQYGLVPFKIAYGSILGFFLLGAAYIAIGLFVSSMTESQVVAAVVSFLVILLTVFMDGIAGMLPTDNKSAFLILAVLLLVLCWITYLMMKNITLSLLLAIVSEIILTAAYFLKPGLFDGIIIKITGWFSVIARFSDVIMGVLDISTIIYYVSIVFLFLFLTVQVIKKSRWS